MPEDRNIWKEETNREAETTYERKEQESAIGSDIPGGDGGVGDGQVKRAGGKEPDGPIGQDHSTDDHRTQAPKSGVGAIQDRDLERGPAHIEGEDTTHQEP